MSSMRPSRLSTQAWRRCLAIALRRSVARTFMVSVTLAAISACTEATKIAAPAPLSPSTPRMLRASGPPKHVREEERLLADLATQAPTAAGMYIASDGGIHVLVVRPTDDGAARAAVASLMSKRQDKSDRLDTRAVTIERAQFTFAELSEWRDLESDSVLTDLPGIVMLDLDERRNRVVVGIAIDAPASTRTAIQKRTARLGIDSGAVVIEAMPATKLQSASLRPMALSATPGYSLTSYFDSLVGGIKIDLPDFGNQSCSSGLVVDHNGVPKLVLPTHCTPIWGGRDNSRIVQGLVARGVESDDPGWYWCGVNRCRDSDAALFTLNSGVHYKRGRIARPASRSNTGPGTLVLDSTNPYFEVSAFDVDNTIVGQEVQKVGLTTGWTYGNVTSTCVDHYYGSYVPFNITRCAYAANYIADIGDSGGPVFKWSSTSGNSALLMGTHFGSVGSDRVFSKFSRIASEMGGTMIVAYVDERPLGAGISGPNYLPVGTAGQWMANEYGGTPPYTFTWNVDGQTITNTSILNFTFQTTGARYIYLTLRDAAGATVTQSYSAYAY